MNADTVDLPEDILESAGLTVQGLKVEMAIHLYAQGRLSAGKARELAGMMLGEFRALLSVRRLPVHVDEQDVEEDLESLRAAGRLG